MDPVIGAAIIGAIATVVGAYVGRKTGVQKGRLEGLEEGRRHSILRFLDEQEKQLERAIAAVKRGDDTQVRAIATAIVDNVMTWREIQENFQALLNGRIDDLAGTLRSDRVSTEALGGIIRALDEGFAVRRLAVETELEKSKI